MHESARNIVHGIKRSETGDQIEPFEGIGLLLGEPIRRFRLRHLHTLSLERPSKFPAVVADDQRTGWLEAQKCKAFQHVFNHVVDHVTGRIGQGLQAEHSAACGDAARGGEDARGCFAGHAFPLQPR